MHEKPVVVLVHGLWMTGLELSWLRRRLKADGFETRQFRYSTVRHNLSHNAERLFRFARDIDAREMHFIGYSLGGVVTLNMLARFHAQLPPGRVVLLGSPVRGSSAARGMVRHRWGRFMLGGAGPECLVEDHGVRWQNPRELGVIAGTRSVGLGGVIGGVPLPNDGTVAVCETHLDGAMDAMELPLTHATLMFSRRVANAVTAFLTSGRFAARRDS